MCSLRMTAIIDTVEPSPPIVRAPVRATPILLQPPWGGQHTALGYSVGSPALPEYGRLQPMHEEFEVIRE